MLTRGILVLIFFLISDDILFILDLQGPTIRVTQLLATFIILRWLFSGLVTGHLYYPRKLGAINLWGLFCLVDAIALINSPWLLKSAIYLAWLCFNYFFLIAILFKIHEQTSHFLWAFRWYLYSFSSLALFGMLQFLMGSVFGTSLLVQQWWFQGSLPRVNGLSFEPSYYVTYMIVGVVLWSFAWRDQWQFVKRHGWHFCLVTVATLMSTARTAWLGLGILAVVHMTLGARGVLRRGWRSIALAVMLLGFLGGLIYTAATKWEFLLSGTGLAGSSAHSFVERMIRASEVWTVFETNPFFGVGLGSIGAAIVHQQGLQIGTLTEIWSVEPCVVALEILAGTGTIGFIFWLCGILWTARSLYRLAGAPNLSCEWRSLATAFLWALVIEMVILQLNQNFLRFYVWLQLGLTLAYINVAHRASVFKR